MGHALFTWQHPETKSMWLNNLLPHAMPASRIMSYGYDANIYASKSALHIMDNAHDLVSEVQARRQSSTVIPYAW